MAKKVLAGFLGLALVAAVVTLPLAGDTYAQSLSGESRVLQAISGLADSIKKETEGLSDLLSNIEDDLQFKKKFWQFQPFPVGGVELVGVFASCPDLPDEACSFNLESVQLDSGGANVTGIFVDGTFTDIRGKQISTPSNLLVDSGIGKVGVREFVAVLFDPQTPYTGDVEFNGEKPQGMQLIKVTSTPLLSDTGNCIGVSGPTSCPGPVAGYVAEAKLKNA
jgi:hypothetical protein